MRRIWLGVAAPFLSGSSATSTGPCDAAAARHPRVVGVAEALERRALVVGDGGEVVHPVLDRDRVGAADAHPAAGLDLLAVGLGDLEHGGARLGDRARAVRERDLGRAGLQHARARERAPGGGGEAAGLAAASADELLLLAVAAQHPRGGQREHRRPQRPLDRVGARLAGDRRHEVGRAVPVEDVEGERAVERGQLVRRDLHERVEQHERRHARRHVERDAARPSRATGIASGASGTSKNASTRPGKAATKNFR